MPTRYDDKLVLYRDKGSESARMLLVAAGIGVALAVAIVLFGKPVVGLLRQGALLPAKEEQLPERLQPAMKELTGSKQEKRPTLSASSVGQSNFSKLQARHPDKVEAATASREAAQDRFAGLPDTARISSR